MTIRGNRNNGRRVGRGGGLAEDREEEVGEVKMSEMVDSWRREGKS